MLERASLIVDSLTSLSALLKLMTQGGHNASNTEIYQPDETVTALSRRVSYALVTKSQQLVGIVTERDLVKLTAQGIDLKHACVADVMSSPLVTISESELNDPLVVLGIFRQQRIRHLPVLKGSQLLGVVTTGSLRQTIQPKVLLKLRLVSDVMTSDVVTASPTATLRELAQLMFVNRVSCVVIVNDEQDEASSKRLRQRPLGIVTEHDIVQFQALSLDVHTVMAQTIMSKPLVYAYPDTSLWEVAQTMQRMRVRRLVVASRSGYLAGIVTQTSFLSVLNPTGIFQTVEVLQEQVNQLKDERLCLMERLNHLLSQQIAESERRFKLTFEQAAAGIANVDIHGRLMQVNLRLCQTLGYSELQLLTKTVFDIVHINDVDDFRFHFEQILQDKATVYTDDRRFTRLDGQTTWLHFTLSQVRTSQENYLVMVVEDISERKQLELELESYRNHLEDLVIKRTAELQSEIVQRQSAERELFREKELAQVTLHSIGDAVVTTDDLGRVTYLNPVAEQLTGWSNTEAVGKPLAKVFVIIHASTRDPMASPVERVLREGAVTGLEDNSVLIARDGAEYGIDDSAAPLRDRNGQMLGSVMVFRDVTQSRKIAQQLSWQANHDSLTGFVNRHKFEEILANALKNAGHQESVLCYIDLDQFKVVNDTCGHTAGDELLQQVALLVKQRVRSVDTLARLGGDEFGLILHGCRLAEAAVIAEKIRLVIHDLRFPWQDVVFRIGASIGLAKIDADFPNIEAIISAADAACYQAKSKGRNRVRTYQSDDSEILQQRGQQQWSLRIKHALEEDKFCLFQQPIRVSESGKTNRYEILLRMIDEDGQLIMPGQFIPAAERYNLMVSIDRWVITHFFEYLSNQDALFLDKTYMVNLSGMSLEDDAFRLFLVNQLSDFQLSPRSICFEITETAAVRNLSQAAEFMHHLKKLGFSFALDDFGSGMSSFAYLKTLPVDYVKIDGDFITDMSVDETAIAIVESIHNVVRVMGLKTIAEFVETEKLFELVQQIGIDFAQGYYVAKPVSLLQS